MSPDGRLFSRTPPTTFQPFGSFWSFSLHPDMSVPLKSFSGFRQRGLGLRGSSGARTPVQGSRFPSSPLSPHAGPGQQVSVFSLGLAAKLRAGTRERPVEGEIGLHLLVLRRERE